MNLEIIRGESSLSEFAPRWHALADRVPGASLCQYPDYHLAFVSAFEPADSEYFVAAVYDQKELVAVFPLKMTSRKVLGLRFKVLEFPDLPMSIRDIVIDPEVAAGPVIDFLVAEVGPAISARWALMDFRPVLETSRLLGDDRGITSILSEQVDYSHKLDVSEPGYVERMLNSKARNNLKRNRKKLSQMGDFSFETIETLPELDSAFESFLETEAAGWKSVRGGKRAVRLHEDQTAFYRSLMHRRAERGEAQIHLLYLDGEPIASDYCILTRDACFSLKHGYDETYKQVAPGNLLREYAVDYYGRSEQVDAIDLVSGLDWHLTWRPERRRVFAVKLFAKSMSGFLLSIAYKARKKKPMESGETN